MNAGYSRCYGPISEILYGIQPIHYRRRVIETTHCFDCAAVLPIAEMHRLPDRTALFCLDCFNRRVHRGHRVCIACERQLPYGAFWQHGQFNAHVCAQCREGWCD